MREGVAGNFDRPKKILAFSRYKRLVAVFASYNECERITGIKHIMIQRAVSGERVASGGYYFRELADDVAIEDSDIGELSLFEYDRDVLGVDMKVYMNGKMEPPAVLESTMANLNAYRYKRR